ncbi:MAG: hypothetical protein JWM95_5001 [Gemmatimonadetes bacterium]|nr:hypothetical protein [Gemmatimonadota bacterium]
MLTSSERESFARRVMDEVHRWPGVEMRPHSTSTPDGEPDGIEFRLFGRQFGHLHSDCGLHLSLTKALKASVLREHLAEPLPAAPNSGWAMFNPIGAADVEHAIWLLRLNYVRLRRQRLTPAAAASSELLQEHEAALNSVSTTIGALLQLTQQRASKRPLPSLDLPQPGQSRGLEQ